MRAQVNFLFIFSAVVFLALLLYVALILINFSSPYFITSRQEIQEMRAIQLSDLLLSTEGKWKNETSGEEGTDWESHQDLVQAIGLAASYHDLSSAKLSALEGLSDDKLREVYGNDSVYSICIREIGSSTCDILDHVNKTFHGKMAGRYAYYENRTVEVMVGVW